EVQVRDIADATILGRLFTVLIEEGTVIVATSNAPPERLYYRGLNRDLFQPFIRLVNERMEVIEIDSPRDFRLGRLMAGPVWFTPPDEAAMDAAFRRLTGAERGESKVLQIKGRTLTVANA